MNKLIQSLGTVLLSVALFSCGPKQELKMWQIDIVQGEENATEVTTLETIIGELQTALSSAIPFETHEYQYTNTNSVDVFAGYLTVNRSTFQYGGPLPHTYYWPNDYYNSAGSLGPIDALYHAYTQAADFGYPEYRAIAEIIYGMTALRATNVKGAISYVDSRNLKASRPLAYQSQQEAYEMILNDLNEAIEILSKTTLDPNVDLKAIEGKDIETGDADYAYSGYDWNKWIQLANTIKLRLAMCLAKPEPEKAQQVATEALSGVGVLEDDFGPKWIKNNTQHPIYPISSSTGWADARMSASIENAMKRLGHPLIASFFTTNSAAINDKTTGSVMLAAQKDYVGIRQGVTMEPKSNGVGYYNFSEVATSVQYIRPTWVCKEEVLFLKAEAALRWGIGGSAQQYYEDGIKAAFSRYNASGVEDYLARTTIERNNGKNIDYIDYYINSNSCEGRVAIGVKWNDADTDETKLEKIITQKWIAMFPNGGYEAWTDFRRTGYPRLIPVPEANKWTGTPSFPVELQIRRVPYNESDENILIDLNNIENALTVYTEKGQNSAGMRMYFEGDPADYPWTYDEDTESSTYGRPIPKNF